VIYFNLKAAAKQEVKIEILDAAGNVIRDYSSKKYETLDEPPDPDDKKQEKEIKPEAGMNRFVWDLHYGKRIESPTTICGNTTKGRAARWRFPATTRCGSQPTARLGRRRWK